MLNYITHTELGYYGGLGNILSQVASILGLAKRNELVPCVFKNNIDIAIPYQGEVNGNTQAPINFLQRFDLFDYFELNDLKIMQRFNGIKIPDAPPGSCIKDNFSTGDNILLSGYLGRLEYFDKYRQYIKTQLKFKDFIIEQCQQIIDNLSLGKKTIAIHIRDYHLAQNLYYKCTSDYYKRALDNFDIDNSSIILFSSNNYKIGRQIMTQLNIDYHYHVWRNKEKYYEDRFYDMCLMSMCDDLIIANSSFSWWAAYLNNKNAKVVVPKQYFSGNFSYMNAYSQYLDQWIKI